jgi:hypothetical protein
VPPLVVELADEDIEAALLLKAVHAERPGGFLFQGEVHAFVTTALHRVTTTI